VSKNLTIPSVNSILKVHPTGNCDVPNWGYEIVLFYSETGKKAAEYVELYSTFIFYRNTTLQ
jgi:hypothetical protein